MLLRFRSPLKVSSGCCELVSSYFFQMVIFQNFLLELVHVLLEIHYTVFSHFCFHISGFFFAFPLVILEHLSNSSTQTHLESLHKFGNFFIIHLDLPKNDVIRRNPGFNLLFNALRIFFLAFRPIVFVQLQGNVSLHFFEFFS
jgi:hypothetical protein